MFLLLGNNTTDLARVSSTARTKSEALGLAPCPPSMTTAPIRTKSSRFPSPRLATTTPNPLERSSACPERSEEHTSELQSRQYLVCRLLLEKKKQQSNIS